MAFFPTTWTHTTTAEPVKAVASGSQAQPTQNDKSDPEKTSAAQQAASGSLAARLSSRIRALLQAQLAKSAPKSKDGASPAPTNFPDLRRLFSLAVPQKKNILIALGLLHISSSITLTVPFAIGRLIDFFTSGQNALYGLGFGTVAALMLFTFVLGAGAKAGSNILLELSGVRVIQGIRNQAYQSALRQDVKLADKGAGDVVSRLSVDTNIVGESPTSDIGDGLRAGATVFFAGTAMFMISSKLTLLMMAVVPPAAIGAVFYGRYLRNLTHKTQDAIGKMTRLAEERLSPPAFRTLTAFNTQRQEARRFDENIRAIVDLQTKEAYASGFFYAGTGFVGNCAILTLLTYGGHLVSRGEISVGDPSSLLMYTAYLGGGMVSLTSFFASLMKGLGAGARVFELIDREFNVALGKGETLEISGTSARLSVRFEKVHFTYPSRPQQPILRGVSLDIEPGQSYALVGGSGAGKSSVHSLLLRFYDPTKGKILLAGQDLASYRPESVRKHFAFVPQEPILFDGSLEENIKYGTESATREQVEEAARMAGCESFISEMPKGLDIVIGSRQLSGGLLVNKAIEEIIKQGKITVWIVAHRLSTIKSANNIHVLQGGRIVEHGTFAQLDRPGTRFNGCSVACSAYAGTGSSGSVSTGAGGELIIRGTYRHRHTRQSQKRQHGAYPPSSPPSSSLDQLDQEFSEEQLDKLHRLSALTPPPLASQERALLKSHLAAMLRLVKGVSRHQRETNPHKASVNDAKKKEEKEEEGVLARQALLARMDAARKYEQFFTIPIDVRMTSSSRSV
ncbi:probable ATP-binding cassette (ABC) transporter [Ustilago sp. UG-2017b]|nr:probable ATP-binding cassette (ABC) transporter [Ustilago sp. UG-2017b]